ncbi:MAG: type I methionyl aminopeptidase [Holosporaceae bacterium]|jgi:methionyl aminopeptidase|nr:type I methionyl aminopeptidase [Holosporaceae bacterium]
MTQKQKCRIYSREDFGELLKAGQLAAHILNYITPFVQKNVSTAELDRLCHEEILRCDAISATLGYSGYPKATCISVNHVVCHGIPSERKLKEGDILNIDVTVILNGWYGDASRMYCVGKISKKAQELIDVARNALSLAVDLVKPGIYLGDIGHAIQTYVESRKFSVVRDYCGHGIGRVFHDNPTVLHFGRPQTGLLLEPGHVFTIEPMVNVGEYKTKLMADGWTAISCDHSLSAQFEHTIGVTETGRQIFTI